MREVSQIVNLPLVDMQPTLCHVNLLLPRMTAIQSQQKYSTIC